MNYISNFITVFLWFVVIVMLLSMFTSCGVQSNCPRGVTWTFSSNDTEFIQDTTTEEDVCVSSNL